MSAAVGTSQGEFKRKQSQFRGVIPSSSYPAVAGRYTLYFNYGCPWAHRANLVWSLKGLEAIVHRVEIGAYDQEKGWHFDGRNGLDRDPNTGVKSLRELYTNVDPTSLISGIASVPVLYDNQTGTIVNNESSEIIRILYSAFDPLLPVPLREESKGDHSLLPAHLQPEIEKMNEWVYETVNNGVYRAGFATTDDAYEAAREKFYTSLDRLERHLSDPAHQPYLFGSYVTEADVRLYPTMIRFDPGYSRFMTRNEASPKLIREDYPNLHTWMQRLYWDESERTLGGAFKKTTSFEIMGELIDRVPGMKDKPAGASPGILKIRS